MWRHYSELHAAHVNSSWTCMRLSPQSSELFAVIFRTKQRQCLTESWCSRLTATETENGLQKRVRIPANYCGHSEAPQIYLFLVLFSNKFRCRKTTFQKRRNSHVSPSLLVLLHSSMMERGCHNWNQIHGTCFMSEQFRVNKLSKLVELGLRLSYATYQSSACIPINN